MFFSVITITELCFYLSKNKRKILSSQKVKIAITQKVKKEKEKSLRHIPKNRPYQPPISSKNREKIPHLHVKFLFHNNSRNPAPFITPISLGFLSGALKPRDYRKTVKQLDRGRPCVG